MPRNTRKNYRNPYTKKTRDHQKHIKQIHGEFQVHYHFKQSHKLIDFVWKDKKRTTIIARCRRCGKKYTPPRKVRQKGSMFTRQGIFYDEAQYNSTIEYFSNQENKEYKDYLKQWKKGNFLAKCSNTTCRAAKMMGLPPKPLYKKGKKNA